MTKDALVLDPVVRDWLRHFEAHAEPPIYKQTPAEGRKSSFGRKPLIRAGRMREATI